MAPETALEQQLTEIWQQVLECPQIGALDDFFELGGNSLVGLRLVSELQSAFNIQMGIHELFDKPNVRALADAIERNLFTSSAQQDPIQPIPLDGRLYPVVLEVESLFQMFTAFGMEEQLFWMPFHLRGKLNLKALQQTLDAMLQRHEPLRSSLLLENGQAWQHIEPFQSLSIPLLDLSTLNAVQQQEQVTQFFAEARFKTCQPGYTIDTVSRHCQIPTKFPHNIVF